MSTPSGDTPAAAAARKAADDWTQVYGDHRAAEQAALDQVKLDALAAEYAEYREAHPDYIRPTLFGSSINGPLFKPAPGGLGYATVPVTRVFLRQLPAGSRWGNIVGDATATRDLTDGCTRASELVWVSFKEADPALVSAFFATCPDNLGLEVWGTFHHEPEDEAPGYPPATFAQQFRAIAPILRRYNVKSVPIFMRYTLQPASGRNLADWWPGAEAVDVLGFDSYNLANKKQSYSDVTTQLEPIANVAKTYGVPWAIGETGAGVFGAPALRAQWAGDLADLAETLDAAAICWWDQDAYVFDAATAKIWLGDPTG